MDPNANLEEQLELASELLNDELTPEESALKGERLAELVEALASWLETGGSLPDAWEI